MRNIWVFCAALLVAVGVSVPAKAEPGDSYVRGGYGIFNSESQSYGLGNQTANPTLDLDSDSGSQFWFAYGFYPDWGGIPVRVEAEIVPQGKFEQEYDLSSGARVADGEFKYSSIGGNIFAEHELFSGVYGAVGIGAGFGSWENTATFVDDPALGNFAGVTLKNSGDDLYYQVILEGRVDFTESVGGVLQVNYITINSDELTDDDKINVRVGLQLDF